MKINPIETPLQYMESLNWNSDQLERSIKMLAEWDNRSDDFYKNTSAFVVKVDKAEREHLRNCVNFWKDKLKNENKPS